MRTILHIDMNSFFASCEVASSGGKYTNDMPLIVTGDPAKRHGIVLAATYAAKKHGVYTTMTIHEALRQCPDAICVKPHHNLYCDYSDKFIQILYLYSPLVERYGLDEAYIDYTGCEHIYGAALQAAQKIRDHIRRELGLTVSIGIGPNKLLAKMGSDYKKPDAITMMDEAFFREKMWDQPVRKLMFIGRHAEPRLNAMGIRTIGDLARISPKLLRQEFGLFGEQMVQYANGIDFSTVEIEHEQVKGVGNSTTLPSDATTIAQIDAVLLALVEQVAFRLRKIGGKAGTISVSLKNTALRTVNKQTKLLLSTDVTDELYNEARTLAKALWNKEPVRLVGVRATQLSFSCEEQASLFSDGKRVKAQHLDRCLDNLRDRFGHAIIKRGSLVANELHAGELAFNDSESSNKEPES